MLSRPTPHASTATRLVAGRVNVVWRSFSVKKVTFVIDSLPVFGCVGFNGVSKAIPCCQRKMLLLVVAASAVVAAAVAAAAAATAAAAAAAPVDVVVVVALLIVLY